VQTLLAILPYVFVLGSIAAMLGLFLGVSQRLAKIGKAGAACEAWVQAEAAQITNAVNELRHRIAELEKLEPQAGSSPEPGVAISNAARGKVFKLHRSGQAADHIAQTLRLPKGEVDLLIKVQRVVMKPYENSGAEVNRPAV